ncbi:MAG: hypothetical protein ACXVB4_09380 [Pseudobdellovibrionaceae bacterium]
MKTWLFGTRILSVLTFCTLVTTIASAMETSCRQKYIAWIQRYGDSDPFLAYQKTSPWDIDKDLLNQIIQSDGQDLNQGLLHVFGLNSPRHPTLVASDFQTFVAQFNKVRAHEINQNMTTFFQRKTSPDTLLIGYAGYHHVIDFFLNHPKFPMTYISRPFDLETRFYTPEYLEFSRALGLGGMERGNVEDRASIYFTIPYASAFAIAKRENMSSLPPEAFLKRVPDLRRLLVGDIHDLRTTELSDTFPGAECLKSLGISKIEVGLEGYSKAEAIDLKSAKWRRTLLEAYSNYAMRRHESLSKLMARLKSIASISDDLMNKFFAGKIIDNPGLYSFLEKLEELSRRGIEIDIVGLESADFIFPEN